MLRRVLAFGLLVLPREIFEIRNRMRKKCFGLGQIAWRPIHPVSESAGLAGS